VYVLVWQCLYQHIMKCTSYICDPNALCAAARTSTLASQASQNPLASLFSLPSFGKRKLLAAARP